LFDELDRKFFGVPPKADKPKADHMRGQDYPPRIGGGSRNVQL
jgi:hypothetical protein